MSAERPYIPGPAQIEKAAASMDEEMKSQAEDREERMVDLSVRLLKTANSLRGPLQQSLNDFDERLHLDEKDGIEMELNSPEIARDIEVAKRIESDIRNSLIELSKLFKT